MRYSQELEDIGQSIGLDHINRGLLAGVTLVAPSSGWRAPIGAALGVHPVLVDGHPVPDGVVPLRVDGREHQVRVALGRGRWYDMADTPQAEEDQDRLPT